ncbi:hypothetical protein [Kangiella sp. TOML190]|uniref:hypothetical protein n=1 Tax=Kangiella sp. TOML190 TaxID=2931351 RepID=UPI00203E2AF2|nr:hypothetical protein [Kangiella sp. TOML190]
MDTVITKNQKVRRLPGFSGNQKITFADPKETIKYQRMLWAEMLKELLQVTKNGLQRKLSDPKSIKYVNKETSTPSFVFKYFEGKHSPKQIVMDRAKLLVPNSDYLFNLPLWLLITRNLEQQEIIDLFLESTLIKEHSFHLSGKSKRFKPAKGNFKDIHEWLINESSIESLNIILLLIAEDELHGTAGLYGKHYGCLIEVICNLFFFEPFSQPKFREFIITSINDRFLQERDIPDELKRFSGRWYVPYEQFNAWIELRKLTINYLQDRRLISNNPERQTLINIFKNISSLSHLQTEDLVCEVMAYPQVEIPLNSKYSIIPLILP